MSKKGIAYTVMSAILYGIIPLISKQVFAQGITVIELGFYRYTLCLPLLALLAKRKKNNFRLTVLQTKNIIIAGTFGVCLTSILLNASYNFLNIGTSTTLHFLYPLFVTLICVIIYHEKICKRKAIALVMALLGISLFIDYGSSSSYFGISLAVFSGLSYAVYIVLIEKKRLTKIDSYVLSFYLSLVASFLFFVIGVLTHSFKLVSDPRLLFELLVISQLSQIFATILLKQGISELGATTASLFCLFEPLTSIIVGYLFLNEIITTFKTIGSIIILIAVAIMALDNYKK